MSGWEGTMSHVANFDDLCRCIQVLNDGSAEEELLRVLQIHEKVRLHCIEATSEAERTQRELDASLQSMADLETKLFHARRLLEIENKARRKAEEERDLIEKKMLAVVDLLQNENNLKNETKDKLAYAIDTLPRKRKSIRQRFDKCGNEINTTGSFLSDLSISYSEDDFIDSQRMSKGAWHTHRPSINNEVPYVGGNRKSRRSSNAAGGEPGGPVITAAGTATTSGSVPGNSRRSARRSACRSNGRINDHYTRSQVMDTHVNNGDRICATTKVSIPPDGSGVIRAESTIETVPINGVCHEDLPHDQLKQTVGNIKHFQSRQLETVIGSGGNTYSKSSSHKTGTLKRPHNFVSKTFIRAETCLHCQKK